MTHVEFVDIFWLKTFAATKTANAILSPPDGAGINLNKLPASLNAAALQLSLDAERFISLADSVTSVRTNKIVTINPVGSDSARHVHKLLSARRTNKIGRKIISAISQERRNKTSAAINCNNTHRFVPARRRQKTSEKAAARRLSFKLQLYFFNLFCAGATGCCWCAGEKFRQPGEKLIWAVFAGERRVSLKAAAFIGVAIKRGGTLRWCSNGAQRDAQGGATSVLMRPPPARSVPPLG
jgi:hypothetical protein